MDLRVLEKSDRDRFVAHLIDHSRVEVVARKNGTWVYTTISSPEPQASPVLKEEPFLLFGIKPYDLKAMGQMDRIISTGITDAPSRSSVSRARAPLKMSNRWNKYHF